MASTIKQLDGRCRWGRIGREVAAAGVAALLLAGCSSVPYTRSDAQRLAQVQAVAGAPVTKFRYVRISGWESFGDQDLLVTTSPRTAWLLHLFGPCRDLEFDPAIGLTSQFGYVSAKFDKVLTKRAFMPCRIDEIRPVDLKALRALKADGAGRTAP